MPPDPPPTDPLLPPQVAVVVDPPGPRADPWPKSITCDFCECRLGRDGGVLATGARARKFAAHEDKSDAMQAEIESLRSQLATCKTDLADRERMLIEDAEKSGSKRARF